jgi:hypothetical protein
VQRTLVAEERAGDADLLSAYEDLRDHGVSSRKIVIILGSKRCRVEGKRAESKQATEDRLVDK